MSEKTGNREIPDLIEVKPQRLPPGAKWRPNIGEETLGLLSQTSVNKLSDQERKSLRDESVAILGHCVPPNAPDTHEAGLIVGNIQSGKTMSFTTVSALARDNHYRIVIVITGTVKILYNQSVKRLINLLRLDSRHDFAWRLYRNPRASQAQAQEMDEILQDWRNPPLAGLQPQTILVTLLKNTTHLRNLSSLLERLDMRGIPSLIIDDEADQAGLNTAVNQGSQSATYRELCRLRRALPHHSYLGYTATPQAPLLINIMDMLSARFAKVLTPGTDYTGGSAFFHHQPSLIRTIPDNQIPSDENPIYEPPESLLEAIRVFFVGVATGLLRRTQEQGPQNRSMLVHPSMLTAQHAAFFQWVQTLKSSWCRQLESIDDADRADRISLEGDFRRAFTDLGTTQTNLPTFEEILQVLPQAIRRTIIYEINRRPSNPFPGIDDIDAFWKSSYSFILVGGQSLERGFTVEGLTVTYMPRGIGVGHADTIQQRARFYGYNLSYLGYCRVYLENDARDAYQVYIEHEDDLRRRLAEHSAAGRPLAEWRRLFFLDSNLKPTRDNVLDVDYTRGPEADRFYTPLPPLYSADDLQENRQLINCFIQGLQLMPDKGDARRTPAQKHMVASGVSLKNVLEKLLVPLRVNDPADSMIFLQILLQVQRYLESNPVATCTIYQMRPMRTDEKRSLDEGGRLQPYQGANSPTGYPGDLKIRDEGRITIQIHHIETVFQDTGSRVEVAKDVPVIGIVLPLDVARGMVVQNQGGPR